MKVGNRLAEKAEMSDLFVRSQGITKSPCGKNLQKYVIVSGSFCVKDYTRREHLDKMNICISSTASIYWH